MKAKKLINLIALIVDAIDADDETSMLLQREKDKIEKRSKLIREILSLKEVPEEERENAFARVKYGASPKTVLKRLKKQYCIKVV
jgi:hypothetical protein